MTRIKRSYHGQREFLSMPHLPRRRVPPSCVLARKQCGPAKRRGVALLIALVCLSVVVAMLGWLIRTAGQERRALDAAQWRQQAQWLADSALARAAARLTRDAHYAGETWNIPAAALRSRHAAQVSIEVKTPAEHPGLRQVRATAVYPDRPYDRAQASRWALVTLSP